jgi:hypothetical protein
VGTGGFLCLICCRVGRFSALPPSMVEFLALTKDLAVPWGRCSGGEAVCSMEVKESGALECLCTTMV